jgi:hypothetical protein
METHVKKTLKLISNQYEIPYEELKSTVKKYLKLAKSFDENLYTNIEELLELVEISNVEEINDYDISVLKMFCKLKQLDPSGSEKEVRKRVTQYFEDLFEELDELSDSEEESESESLEESESDSLVDSSEDQEVIEDLKNNVIGNIVVTSELKEQKSKKEGKKSKK